ncbi:unnamed protein product [Danaus chrysippus]|uniref:(African queen) hypothetical protein n=1 Tax=Danaus chrysippus TaxID=151541 RepID=A0A8J2R5F0_9NEOP|nr:unnamed protein product [Danaus chrysippus]
MSIVSTLFVMTVIHMNFGQEFSWGPTANVSCHYVHSNSTFPLLQSTLPQRSIFFHQTSCPANLTSRQVCSIESAARTHPAWQINVIFSGPVHLETVNGVELLRRFSNIKFWMINIKEFSKNTPLEGLVNSGILSKCQWGMERTRDVLKYLSLYKFGGIFLDLDIVIARSLGSLARNWAARENANKVGDGILAISKNSIGHNMTNVAIRYIVSIYKNNHWCKESQDVVMGVLQKLCSTNDANYMSSATCNGFEVYGSQFFYPIGKQSAREYFVPGEVQDHSAYIYHLWGDVTNGYKISKSSPYSKLARRFCPNAYGLYFED